MKVNKISQNFIGVTVCFCSVVKYFIAFQFCFRSFQKLTAKFWFCLDQIEILNWPWQWWKSKMSISQLPNNQQFISSYSFGHCVEIRIFYFVASVYLLWPLWCGVKVQSRFKTLFSCPHSFQSAYLDR